MITMNILQVCTLSTGIIQVSENDRFLNANSFYVMTFKSDFGSNVGAIKYRIKYTHRGRNIRQRRMSIRTPLQPVGRKTRICKFFPTNPCLINDIGKHIQMSLQQ